MPRKIRYPLYPATIFPGGKKADFQEEPMDKLIAELQRLFFWPGQVVPDLAECLGGQGQALLELSDEVGQVRLMVLEFLQAGDWEAVAGLYQALETEQELPLPALAVSGRGAYQLWFSLAGPVPRAEAREFLQGLRRHYLAELPLSRLRFFPEAQEGARVLLVPAFDPDSGRWSAFIDPAMGAMFVDEPGLAMAPGLERQADLLAGFTPMSPAELQRVLGLWRTGAGHAPSEEPVPAIHYQDPRDFLRAVMNDPGIGIRDRIRAAKILLASPAPQPGGKQG